MKENRFVQYRSITFVDTTSIDTCDSIFLHLSSVALILKRYFLSNRSNKKKSIKFRKTNFPPLFYVLNLIKVVLI